MADWTIRDIPALTGKLAVITGTGGIGLETAIALGQAGADIVIAGRNVEKGAEAVRQVRAVSSADVRFAQVDLADLASVRRFAEGMTASDRAIDLLINNAGIMMPKQRTLTKDGFELQLGVNHLGHFALTGLLLPLVKRAPGARIVTISSGAHLSGKIFFDNLQLEDGKYPAFKGYQQSKLANMLFMRELDRRSRASNWGVASVAAHPGYARTDLIANGPEKWGPFGILSGIFDLIGQDAKGGALPTLYAATVADVVSGKYYGPRWNVKGPPGIAKIGKPAFDDAAAEKLWAISEQLTSIKYD